MLNKVENKIDSFLNRVTSFFKSWFNERHGKNVDEKHLYAWAKENHYFINRFNPLHESSNVMVGIVNHPSFEVEVIGTDAKKRGFLFEITYDMVSISPTITEIDIDQLEFKKSFRLEGDEIMSYTDELEKGKKAVNS